MSRPCCSADPDGYIHGSADACSGDNIYPCEMPGEHHPYVPGQPAKEPIEALRDLDFSSLLGPDMEQVITAAFDTERMREILWLGHGHGPYLYGDDGQMQCRPCSPTWDYKNAAIADVVRAAFAPPPLRITAQVDG